MYRKENLHLNIFSEVLNLIFDSPNIHDTQLQRIATTAIITFSYIYLYIVTLRVTYKTGFMVGFIVPYTLTTRDYR
jgi:hypothetical protein